MLWAAWLCYGHLGNHGIGLNVHISNKLLHNIQLVVSPAVTSYLKFLCQVHGALQL